MIALNTEHFNRLLVKKETLSAVVVESVIVHLMKTYTNQPLRGGIIADHVYPFMDTVFPDDGSGLFQQEKWLRNTNSRC